MEGRRRRRISGGRGPPCRPPPERRQSQSESDPATAGRPPESIPRLSNSITASASASATRSARSLKLAAFPPTENPAARPICSPSSSWSMPAGSAVTTRIIAHLLFQFSRWRLLSLRELVISWPPPHTMKQWIHFGTACRSIRLGRGCGLCIQGTTHSGGPTPT